MNVLKFSVVGIAFLACCQAWAQTASTSTLNGTIFDNQKAVIPGATISARDTVAGAVRMATANSAGQYSLQSLLPSVYDITIQANGFRTLLSKGVALEVAKAATLDFTLEVGDTATTVSVSAAAESPLQTVDSSFGNTMSTEMVAELPVLGRQATALMALQPTATSTGQVAGAQYDQTTILLDGVNISNIQNGAAFGTYINVPNESIEEFRVVDSNPNASFFNGSGAQVVMYTKRGSNAWHGSAYDYLRNNDLNANLWQSNRVGTARAFDHDNRFGGSFSGPIIKNKTFFYANIEARQLDLQSLVSRTVPTASLRQGIIEFRDATGTVQQINPTTYDPRGLGANPQVLKYLQAYPVGNNPAVGDGLNTTGFQFVTKTPTADTFGLVRLDHTFTPKWSFAGSARLDSTRSLTTTQISLLSQDSIYVSMDHPRFFNGALTGILTPNMTNRFSYTWNQDRLYSQPTVPTGLEGFNSPVEVALTYLNQLVDDAQSNAKIQLKQLSFNQFEDNLTWLKGKHQIQAGFHLNTYRSNALRTDHGNFLTSPTAIIGSYQFLTVPTAQRPSFLLSSNVSAYNQYYSALLGQLDQVDIVGVRDGNLQALPAGTPIITDAEAKNYSFYAQDTWKVTSTLTFTYGLAYQFETPPTEAQGRFTMEALAGGGLVDPNAYLKTKLSDAQQGILYSPTINFPTLKSLNRSSVYNTDYHDFSPRLSAAWSPNFTGGLMGKLFGDRKTVLRGGFGRVYDFTNLTTTITLPQFGEGFAQTLEINAPLNSAGQPYRVGVDGAIPIPQITSATSPVTVNGPYGDNYPVYLNPNLKTPHANVIDATLQREFGSGWMVETGFIARLGRNMYDIVNLDSVPYMFKDPKSGQTMAAAFDAVANQLRSGVAAAQVTPQPFFENMLPGKGTAFLVNGQSAGFVNGNLNAVASLMDQNMAVPFDNIQTQDNEFRTNNALSNYFAGVLTVSKRMAKSLSVRANYTLSHSTDTLGEIQNGIQPYSTSFAPGNDYGSSSYDRRNAFNGLFVYNLPVGKDMLIGIRNRGLDKIIGGWYVSGILTAATGVPLVVAGSSSSYGAYGGSLADLTANVGAIPLTSMSYGSGLHANVPGSSGIGVTGNPASGGAGLNLFANPQAVYANFRPVEISLDTINGRDYIRGQGLWNLDMALGKTFVFTERFSLRFTAEAFNVFNHPNFADPSLSLSSPTSFGVITGQTNSTDGLGVRRLQLGLRLAF